MRILLGLGLLPLALLAGCQSNEQIMAEARAKGLELCNNSPQVKQAPAGFDTTKFCNCLVDKTFSGKTPDDIEKMTDAQRGEMGARAGLECASAQVPAVPATDPNAVPAPAPTNEVATETIEETADEAE